MTSDRFSSRKTYIFISQKVGAELQVIIEIKRPTGLETSPEGSDGGSFGQLPHALDTSELTLGILGSHLRSTTRPAVVVI